MRQSILKAALAATSALLMAQPVLAQAQGLTAQIYQGCYSSSSSFPLVLNGSATFQSTGFCTNQCAPLAKPIFAVSKGSDCYCGDMIPANSTKVADSQCNVKCQGYPQQMCGGLTTFSVYTTGIAGASIEIQDGSAASSSDGSAPTATGSGDSQKQTVAPSTITQAGKTIVVTAPSSPTATGESGKSSSGGTNTAAIAAGAVVGIVAIVAVSVGVFFLMRHKKRRQIEEEHRREQAASNFGYSGTGTVKSRSEGSTADSRLGSSLHYRRQSDGSIAADDDFSRRVLKVTNPDRA